jgi:hypothetical protein
MSWIDSLSGEAHQKLGAALLLLDEGLHDPDMLTHGVLRRMHRSLASARSLIRCMRENHVTPSLRQPRGES